MGFLNNMPLFKYKSRSSSPQPNNARDVGKKKYSDAVSEHRDSSDMNEDKYIRAPRRIHEMDTVADSGGNPWGELDFEVDFGGDSGAADLDFDDDMAVLYVDERASEGLARIGERVEEDGREGEEGEDERKEPQEANETVAVKRARNTLAARKSRAADFRRDETSVADRLLAAWTTVKPVI